MSITKLLRESLISIALAAICAFAFTVTIYLFSARFIEWVGFLPIFLVAFVWILIGRLLWVREESKRNEAE